MKFACCLCGTMNDTCVECERHLVSLLIFWQSAAANRHCSSVSLRGMSNCNGVLVCGFATLFYFLYFHFVSSPAVPLYYIPPSFDSNSCKHCAWSFSSCNLCFSFGHRISSYSQPTSVSSPLSSSKSLYELLTLSFLAVSFIVFALFFKPMFILFLSIFECQFKSSSFRTILFL